MAGGVDAPQRDVANGYLGTVRQGIVRVRDLGGRVDADRDSVLEREPAVTRDVVGVRVGLDGAHDTDAEPGCLVEQVSIASGGSTTTASPASSQPTRYEAQPRSSFRICAKSTAGRR